MKIVSYNINGIRSATKAGLLEFIDELDADVYCFQEVRANETITKQIIEGQDVQISLFESEKSKNPLDRYYKIYNCGDIAGYAGTMILTKMKPSKISYDMNDFWRDNEGRTTTIFIDNLAIVNAYIPNGNSRLEFKMKYLEALLNYLKNLKQNHTVICVGDFNIAHNEIDLTNPKECKNKSVFLPIERSMFDKFIEAGFIDCFRYLYPQKEEYSWRSYRSRQVTDVKSNRNFWKYRIDYILLSSLSGHNIKECEMPDLVYSDHLPVIATLDKINNVK